jgi:hypothetical protein
MAEEPIRDERIIEAIEVCRPGSHDVSNPALGFLAAEMAAQPELDELYERCQRLDARLAAAFVDVPVPEGLAERLLARLQPPSAASLPVAEAAAQLLPDEPPSDPAAVVACRPRRIGRRWLVGAALVASAAASVLIAITHPAQPRLSPDQLCEAAISFFCSDSPEQSGQLLTGANEPENLPFSRDVRFFRGTTWRSIHGFLGRSGVAYDLTSGAGISATLYVVAADAGGTDGLPGAPPSYDHTFGTRGCRSAAWQANGVLYVLVIQGDSKRAYDAFVLPPGQVT